MDEDGTTNVLLVYSDDGWSVSSDSLPTTDVTATGSFMSFDTEYTELTGEVSRDEVLLQTSTTLSCSGGEGKEICGDVALIQLLIDSVLLSCMSNPENKSLFTAFFRLSKIPAKERRSKGTSATERKNVILNSLI
jgi:hypothetical protein